MHIVVWWLLSGIVVLLANATGFYLMNDGNAAQSWFIITAIAAITCIALELAFKRKRPLSWAWFLVWIFQPLGAFLTFYRNWGQVVGSSAPERTDGAFFIGCLFLPIGAFYFTVDGHAELSRICVGLAVGSITLMLQVTVAAILPRVKELKSM